MWNGIFEREIEQATQSAIQEIEASSNCKVAARAATAKLTRIVQQFECAVIAESNLGVTGADAVIARQRKQNGGDPSITPFDGLAYWEAESTDIEQALNTSRNTMDYILQSPSFRCDVVVHVTVNGNTHGAAESSSNMSSIWNAENGNGDTGNPNDNGDQNFFPPIIVEPPQDEPPESLPPEENPPENTDGF